MPDMIKNDQHYETTKYWVEKFAHTLDSLRLRSKESLKDLHPLLAKAQEDAAASVLQRKNARYNSTRLKITSRRPWRQSGMSQPSCTVEQAIRPWQ